MRVRHGHWGADTNTVVGGGSTPVLRYALPCDGMAQAMKLTKLGAIVSEASTALTTQSPAA